MKVLAFGEGRRLGLAPQVAVVLLVVGLAGAMAIEPTRQLLEQRSRIAGTTDELRAIREANDRLEKRINRLQDPDYLEQQARASGLVRPGETAVVVMPPPERDEPRPKTPAAGTPEEPAPDPVFIDSMIEFLGLR